MATKKKTKTRKVKNVKEASCRTAGHQMNAENPLLRKAGAKKLGSKTCKTRAEIKKSTSKVAEISKKAKKIRVKGESWTNAIRRAAKLV